MYLKGNPFNIKGNVFCYDVDNSLADVAERSDIIKKNADHVMLSFNSHRLQALIFFLSPERREILCHKVFLGIYTFAAHDV